MISVGSYEAKTNLPKLLDKVANGERILITRHGVPVAILIPSPSRKKIKVSEIIDTIFNFQKKHTLDGLSLKELINKGRE